MNSISAPLPAHLHTLEFQTLHSAAERQAARGRTGRAFQQAADAWRLVQPHAQHPASRELAGQIQRTLRRLGEAANRNSGAAGGARLLDKRLEVQ